MQTCGRFEASVRRFGFTLDSRPTYRSQLLTNKGAESSVPALQFEGPSDVASGLQVDGSGFFV